MSALYTIRQALQEIILASISVSGYPLYSTEY